MVNQLVARITRLLNDQHVLGTFEYWTDQASDPGIRVANAELALSDGQGRVLAVVVQGSEVFFTVGASTHGDLSCADPTDRDDQILALFEAVGGGGVEKQWTKGGRPSWSVVTFASRRPFTRLILGHPPRTPFRPQNS